MNAIYRRYFEELPCYVTVQDRDFRIVESNKRFKEDFGDGAGLFCFEAYKQRTSKCDFCPVELTFRDGIGHGSEEIVKTKSGKEVPVIVYTTPLTDDSGKVVKVMEMSTDITLMKILEAQLRESQKRYRLLFEEAPCYISIQDRELNLMEVNRRFREDFGEPAGGKCYQVYKHRDKPCSICLVAQSFRDGRMHQSEEVVTTKSGEPINVLCTTAPLVDENGEISSVMEMSTNITQVRQLQSQLTSIGMLLSSISHSLKGLLNGLDGGIYLVNSGMEKNDDKRIKKGWEMVQRNVDRIRNMVMDILYYAKERELNIKTVEAVQFLDDVIKIMEKKAGEHGIIIERSLDPTTGRFDADPNALRSMLTNIMENCIDACRTDTKTCSHFVRVSAEGNERDVVITISDNGIGMDRETREKATTMFFSSKGTEGTGLGLFIADRIVKQHHGKLEIESESGLGTTFKIILPRRYSKE